MTHSEHDVVKVELEQIFGREHVTDTEFNLLPYSYDATECPPKMPEFVCIVQNTEQVISVVKLANKFKIPLVPYISGNNIGGLTIPQKGGIILDFGKKMNKILYVHESHMYALLEPGVTFGQLYKHLNENYPKLRYCYPFAPPYSGVVGNAILSGMNNMSSAHGSMGDWINGLEVVLHDGSVTRIGSCFLGKDYKPDNWHSRYPMPDLMGLFINWQGMTGIVTKCAVQLWPKMPIDTTLLFTSYGAETTAELIRELGRLELVDDISAVSVEVAKMALQDPNPKKYDKEPDYCILVPISAHNREHYNVKYKIITELANNLNKKKENRNKIQTVDFNGFAECVGSRVRVFRDLPAVITPLVEYSGLTWVGTYAPLDNLGTMIRQGEELFHKFDIPAFVYMKTMKSSHYGIYRPIIRYKKELEEERMRKFTEEMLEIALNNGCIPYKTPIWMAKRLQELIDPNWLKLFKSTKKFMDPNNIFNPGRWGLD